MGCSFDASGTLSFSSTRSACSRIQKQPPYLIPVRNHAVHVCNDMQVIPAHLFGTGDREPLRYRLLPHQQYVNMGEPLGLVTLPKLPVQSNLADHCRKSIRFILTAIHTGSCVIAGSDPRYLHAMPYRLCLYRMMLGSHACRAVRPSTGQGPPAGRGRPPCRWRLAV